MLETSCACISSDKTERKVIQYMRGTYISNLVLERLTVRLGSLGDTASG